MITIVNFDWSFQIGIQVRPHQKSIFHFKLTQLCSQLPLAGSHSWIFSRGRHRDRDVMTISAELTVHRYVTMALTYECYFSYLHVLFLTQSFLCSVGTQLYQNFVPVISTKCHGVISMRVYLFTHIACNLARSIALYAML